MPSPAPSVPTPAFRDALGYGLGFAGVVIFGGTLPMTRIAVTVFDPWFITTGRAALASVLALALLVLMRRRPPPAAAWRSLAPAAVATLFGFPILSSIAMQTVPASHGGVVLGLLPLATSVAAVVINGERPTALFWFWSLIGAALVVGFSIRNGAAGFGWGDLLLLASVASASAGYAWFARAAPWVSGWEASCWALVLMAPLNLPAALFLYQPAYAAAPPMAVAAMLYVSVFSVFIGFFFWNAGLAIGGVARVGQIQLLQTFVTLAIAAWLNGETVDGETIGFAVAVMGVVLLARRAAGPRRPDPASG